MPKIKTTGYTLIELMIVVAVIGILATIGTPKFANLTRKSHEAITKGNLAILRTTLDVYFSDNEGFYPYGNPTSSLIPRYLDQMPRCYTHHHPQSTNIQDYGGIMGDTGGWGYWMEAHSEWGKIFIDCTHTDLRGTILSTW
ncbi:type II secretion system protein [bacterium]|nr:type II secretion system protein [bacterium]